MFHICEITYSVWWFSFLNMPECQSAGPWRKPFWTRNFKDIITWRGTCFVKVFSTYNCITFPFDHLQLSWTSSRFWFIARLSLHLENYLFNLISNKPCLILSSTIYCLGMAGLLGIVKTALSWQYLGVWREREKGTDSLLTHIEKLYYMRLFKWVTYFNYLRWIFLPFFT